MRLDAHGERRLLSGVTNRHHSGRPGVRLRADAQRGPRTRAQTAFGKQRQRSGSAVCWEALNVKVPGDDGADAVAYVMASVAPGASWSPR